MVAAAVRATAVVAAATRNVNSPADCTVLSVGCGEGDAVGCVAGFWVGEAEAEEGCGD